MADVFLKVKIKSLAQEARIIRHEERKAKIRKQGELRESLRFHRMQVVRAESRATNLAYGLLRGRRYSELEHKRWTKPDWKNVIRMVAKYGRQTTTEAEVAVKAWSTQE